MKRKKSTLMAMLVMAIVSLMPCTVVGQENKFTITGKASKFIPCPSTKKKTRTIATNLRGNALTKRMEELTGKEL